MQVKELKSEGLRHELEITVPLKVIEGHVETRLKEVGKTVKIQGFRQGKVPMTILKKRYGRAVLGEVLEKAVNESSAQALIDKKIKPAMQPKIEVTEFDEGKDLTYKMNVESLPEIKLADFSKMKVQKPVAKAQDKEIEDALNRIADNNMTTVKVESDRKTKKGDVLLIDFDGRTKDDDVKHQGMKASGHKLELGSGQFIPGFEDQLIGKKAGDRVEVEVSFPAQYQATELAGRDAIFDVEIHEIHEKTKAEINDDFAKIIGFDTLEALREAIIQQMDNEYGQFTRMKMKRSLLDQLDEHHDIESPQQMVEAEYAAIIKQAEQQAQQNGEEEGLSDEDKEELKEIAGRRVRLGLILSEVGNKNEIVVTDQELQQAVIREAQKFPGQEKIVFEFYQKNPQALQSMRAPLFEDKVVDYLFEQVKVEEKEVSVEDLTKEDEDDMIVKPKKTKKATSSKKKSTDKNKTNIDKAEVDCCSSGTCETGAHEVASSNKKSAVEPKAKAPAKKKPAKKKKAD